MEEGLMIELLIQFGVLIFIVYLMHGLRNVFHSGSDHESKKGGKVISKSKGWRL